MASCTFSVRAPRTRWYSVAFRNSWSRQKRACSALSSMAPTSRAMSAAMAITIRMETSIASSALPRGLHVRRSRPPLLLATFGVAGAGIALGMIFTQASTIELFGALVVVLAAATAFYRPAATLALLAFTYPFDLHTFAVP